MSIESYPSPNGVLTSLIWRKTMSGGETSLSGYDNASQALSYTPGQEQVYLNGILLVRGDDYTATNGTSITGLTALAASDFVQINCYNNYSVASVPSTSITGTIANNQLANSAITINGSSVSLGGTVTVSSASSTETLTNKTISGSSNTISNIGNSSLTNSSITVNGTSVSLGGSVSAIAVPVWVRLTSGTSWSVPAGIKTATIWAIGGGGGGASARGDGYKYAGGGGGAGGLATGTFDLSSVAGSTISYAIGAGGAGAAQNTSTGAPGSNGGNTTFGTSGQAWYLSATGGGTGGTQGGGGPGSGGCGGGGGGQGGSGGAGGGGGGLGTAGLDAYPYSAQMYIGEGQQGNHGGHGGNGVSGSQTGGAGGSGIFINGYMVGGGGAGGLLQGNMYIPTTYFGGAGPNPNGGAPTSATANTGGGGAGGSNTTSANTGYAGGSGGSGVIFIQYWT